MTPIRDTAFTEFQEEFGLPHLKWEIGQGYPLFRFGEFRKSHLVISFKISRRDSFRRSIGKSLFIRSRNVLPPPDSDETIALLTVVFRIRMSEEGSTTKPASPIARGIPFTDVPTGTHSHRAASHSAFGRPSCMESWQ